MIFGEETLSSYNTTRVLPFDYISFTDAIKHIVYDQNKTIGCNMLKDVLNNFFKNDAKCRSVIYTNNTDKDFFGIYIKPVFSKEAIDYIMDSILNKDSDSCVQITSYSVELDSQLIDCIKYADSAVGITADLPTLAPAELSALLVHDINEIIGCNVINKIIQAINAIASFTRETVDVFKLELSMNLFKYVLMDTSRGLTSALCKKDDDNFANEFIRIYGLTQAYDNALLCVQRLRRLYHNDLAISNIMVLNWYMNIYKKLIDDCIRENHYVIEMLTKALSYTGSEFEKVAITLAIEEIQNIPYTFKDRREKYEKRENILYPIGSYINSTVVKESFGMRIKMNGIQAIEDDLYEFDIRVKNVTDEYTAINLMREINANMNMLANYIRYEKLSEYDRKKIDDLYNKYTILRDKLTNATIYKNKNYGLFIDYNALDQMTEKEKRALLYNMR